MISVKIYPAARPCESEFNQPSWLQSLKWKAIEATMMINATWSHCIAHLWNGHMSCINSSVEFAFWRSLLIGYQERVKWKVSTRTTNGFLTFWSKTSERYKIVSRFLLSISIPFIWTHWSRRHFVSVGESKGWAYIPVIVMTIVRIFEL